MASKTEMVELVMDELGKDSPTARSQITRAVGGVTKDLLSQNEGRFSGLSARQNLTYTTSDTQKKLNKDFNTPKPTSLIVDSDGNYAGEFYVVSENEFYRRQANSSEYPGATYGRIERLTDGAEGDGDYLIFGAAPSATQYIRFLYYRKPTADDTNVIRNEEIVRIGTYARLKRFNSDYDLHLKIYFTMRSGFRESPELRASRLAMRPSRRKEDYNKMMHDIGEGG